MRLIRIVFFARGVMRITKDARTHAVSLRTVHAGCDSIGQRVIKIFIEGRENMPRTYRSFEERQKAEHKRFNNKQDSALRVELLKAKKEQRLTYNELAQKASISVSTARRILDVSFDLGVVELDKLRNVCGALGVRLTFCTE